MTPTEEEVLPSELDLVAVISQAGVVVVGVGLLDQVPAEGHVQDALTEELDLFTAVDGRVKVDAVQAPEQLEGLDVLGRVRGVHGVLGIGEGAAVEVVDQDAGALVAALAAAVDSTVSRQS